jgi:hypothetical protein
MPHEGEDEGEESELFMASRTHNHNLVWSRISNPHARHHLVACTHVAKEAHWGKDIGCNTHGAFGRVVDSKKAAVRWGFGKATVGCGLRKAIR